MVEDNKKNKKPDWKSLIVLAVVLMVLVPGLMAVLIPLGVLGGIVYLVARNGKQQQKSIPEKTGNDAQRQPAVRDDCPKPFCFHKDKGEHHLYKGREADPWDRPDIDISKYQRKE